MQENQIIDNQLKQELTSIEEKTHKIENIVHKDLDQQMDNFQKMKKMKRTKTKKPQQLVQPQIPTPRRSSNPSGRRGSKYDVVVDALVMTKGVSEKDVLLDILEHSERQMKNYQEQMQKEIDDFINKSIKEMNDAIDELRISYMEDLKEVDGKPILTKENVFPDLVDELKSDMEQEIEILREKYEELRYKETEKIRNKYMKLMNN